MSRLAKDINVAHLPQQEQAGVVNSYPEFNLLSRWQIDNKISKDIGIAHSRRWPNRPISLASCLELLATSPGLRLILVHRMAHLLYLKRKNDSDRKWLWRTLLIPIGLVKFVMMKINAKSDFVSDCEIEDGVFFSDQGNIIFGAIKTGAGTVIGTRVTVGMGHTDKGRPQIGRNVWIGSDCVIFGSISIGDGATLLPGTVLTKNIPAGVVIQGNPPRLVLQHFDNSELRERQDLDAVHYVNAKRGG